jgi:hypothetical protein
MKFFDTDMESFAAGSGIRDGKNSDPDGSKNLKKKEGPNVQNLCEEWN